MEIETLMTPEFVEFSQKIAELYKQREDKNSHFKEIYVQHKADMVDIEKQVKTLKDEFEARFKKD